jgi:uncharacterized protein (TIGR02996 family)
MRAVTRSRRGKGDLLEDALDVWDATRRAKLADVVDVLTAEGRKLWAKPHAKAADVFQRKWLDTLEHPVGRGWAATALFEQLPGDDGSARSTALAERLRAAVGQGPDPRIAFAVATALAAEHELFGYFGVGTVVEEVLLHGRDERVRDTLREAAIDDDRLAAIAKRVLDAEAIGREPTRRELDRFAIQTAPRGGTVDATQLLAQVYERPGDDEPRRVLADALQAVGDPRGELIALQLMPGDDESRLRRIDQMVKACGADWLGQLAEIAYRVQFARGFLAKLELKKTLPTYFHQLVEHPMLATVEELIPGEEQGARYAELVASPALRALRRIEVHGKEALDALPSITAAIDHVACPWIKRGGGNYIQALSKRVLPECARRPAVRSLGVAIEGFEAVVASRLLERLSSITIGSPQLGPALALWSKLPQSCKLVTKRNAALEECVGVRTAWLGDLALERDGREVIGRVWGDWLIDEAIEAELPVTRLEVAGASPQQITRLKRKNRKIEIVLMPAPSRAGYLTIGRG